MSLIPWRNKQRDVVPSDLSLTSLRADLDRLFDTLVREPFSAMEWPFAPSGKWSPTIDVSENDQEITVRAELPGVTPEDLDVTVSGQQLILSGEKKETSEKKGKDFYQSESRFGSFRRSIPLPQAVDAQKVEAEYGNGVLTVHLPKSPEAAVKRIEVKPKGA